jgi:hypothetical protein
MQANELSRRQLFLHSAVTFAGLGLSSALLTSHRARAEVDPVPNPQADNEWLNRLLGTEYDLVACYDFAQPLIAQDASTPQTERSNVTKLAMHFQDQHRQHALALRTLIVAHGGTPAADDMKVALPSALDTTSAKTLQLIQLGADKERDAAVQFAEAMLSLSTHPAASLVAAIGAVHSQQFTLMYLLAERILTLTAAAGTNPDQVVPAAFILALGGPNTVNLETLPELDTLLTLDPGS